MAPLIELMQLRKPIVTIDSVTHLLDSKKSYLQVTMQNSRSSRILQYDLDEAEEIPPTEEEV